MPPLLRQVFSWLTTLMLIAGGGLAIVCFLVPMLMGAVPLTVLTGSMAPTYQPGDMLVVKPYQDNNQDPAPGDAVTYQVRPDENVFITHRITEKAWSSDGSLYTLRGDANNADDEPVIAAQIMGKVMYSVPKVGYVQDLLGQWALHFRMLAVIGLTAYIISLMVPDRWSSRFRKPEREAAPGSDDGAGQVEDDAQPSS